MDELSSTKADDAYRHGTEIEREEDMVKKSMTEAETINALEELQEYRKIGSVEDLKRLRYLRRRYEDESYDYCGEHGTSECGAKAQLERLKVYEAIGTVEECMKARKKEDMIKGLVYVCSPYRGDTERNITYARELTRAALEYGYTPITPHLYLTQALDDENPEERELGMLAGQELLKRCEYILIGSRYGISEGMQQEIMIAHEARLKVLALTKKGLEKVYG